MLIYGNQPILVGFSHISWFLYTVLSAIYSTWFPIKRWPASALKTSSHTKRWKYKRTKTKLQTRTFFWQLGSDFSKSQNPCFSGRLVSFFCLNDWLLFCLIWAVFVSRSLAANETEWSRTWIKPAAKPRWVHQLPLEPWNWETLGQVR